MKNINIEKKSENMDSTKIPATYTYLRYEAKTPVAKTTCKIAPLTREQKNALAKLRDARDTFILHPCGLFDTKNAYHNEMVSYIKDRSLGNMLQRAGLPYLDLECHENYIIEDTAFGTGSTIEFEYKPGIKMNLTREKAKNIDIETTFYVIKEVQKYLYYIDQEYGTTYMSLDNPQLSLVSKCFVRTVECECSFQNSIKRTYENELKYFHLWIAAKFHN